MKFWDTSALVPLVIDEPGTEPMRRLLAADPAIVVWALSGVEMLSALGQLGRSANGLEDLLPSLRQDVLAQFTRCASVTDVDGVRRRAERLVGVHPLTAADAMQIGAALVAASDRPETLEFVTLDRVLARAAQLEGFRVLPATGRA